MNMNLFKKESFISAAGLKLDWKIECDALTDEDWQCIADVSVKHLKPFSAVYGVQSGGLKLAKAFGKYLSIIPRPQILIVDDVWTTGHSMINFVKENFPPTDWQGFVAFARGVPLPWVSYFMLSKYL